MHRSTYDNWLKNTIPMKFNKDEVCVLIPTLNEGPTIGNVVREFKAQGYNNILVVDGKSTDNTVKTAR
jgi:glycosyltransferase involved in cell wall biosynthesis